MIVLGLTGFAGSGKSTVAQYLVEQHGFTRMSFAAPLKKMLRTLDPVLGHGEYGGYGPHQLIQLSDLIEDCMTEQDIKESEWGDEYRRLLQVLGTDCIRSIDPEFWIKAAEKNLTDPNGKYVFDDVRFPNEAELIRKYGVRGLWQIMRPGYGAVNGHASEQHAGNMREYIILLNRDLEGLHDQIDQAVELGYAGDVAA